MEEQVKMDNVIVEVQEKKKFFTKKRLYIIGGTVAALAVAGVALVLRKGKDGDQGEEPNQFVDATYESVSNSEMNE